MKKRKSLSKMMITLQILLFSMVGLFIALAGVRYHRQALADISAEKKLLIQSQVKEVEARMNADSLQLTEILRSVLDNNGLWSANSDDKYFNKMELQRNMQDKALLYRDMEMLFVYRPDDFLLRNATSQTGEERLALRDFIEANASKLATTPAENRWRLQKAGNKKYCFLVYYYQNADIYVGTAVSCASMYEKIDGLFLEAEGGFTVRDESGEVFSSANEASEVDGNVRFEGISAGGGLLLDACFNVGYLEIQKQNIFVIMAMVGLVCIMSLLIQNFILNKAVIRPVTELSETVKDAKEEVEQIVIQENAETEEVFILQSTLNHLFREVISARLQLYENRVQEQDMELRQLRAQLRPHFYLNAIMTINSMTYQDRNADIREFLSCLSDHMRYMFRITTGMARLEEELKHVENYVDMQEIKFPSSVLLMTECPPELSRMEIPHLILYTVVENALKYAMDLSETLVLLIHCESLKTEEFVGYRVVIEDNGPGFSQGTIQLYNGEAILQDDGGRHIGLSNVKRSLQLQYKRKDLLILSNTAPKGARIEIRIPQERKDEDDCTNRG